MRSTAEVAVRASVAVIISVLVSLAALSSDGTRTPAPTPLGRPTLEGRAPTALELEPSVEAAFPRESYGSGSVASVVVFKRAPRVTVQIFRSGPEELGTRGRNEMVGVPVTSARRVGTLSRGDRVPVRVGNWPSGLYFARLTSASGLVGFAPFVVRPTRLGEHDVATSCPRVPGRRTTCETKTATAWGDSWYAAWRIRKVRLGRPLLNRGVPYNFRLYDLPFLRWLARNEKHVDVLADADLDAVPNGRTLSRAYTLVIFPGHHEYVTTHEYDVIER